MPSQHTGQRPAFSPCSDVEDVSVFVYIETGAGFVGELAMSVYGSGWKARVQFREELRKGFLLRLCSGVCRGLAIFSKATDIADTNTVGVVVQAVRSHLCKRSACVYAAVAVDDVVVADVAEASLLVPSANVRNGVVATVCGRAAMEDDFFDASHLDEGLRVKILLVSM